jgi:uncharacterized repeat protein (TIGR03803 family)
VEDGIYPAGGLLLDSAGNLYGTTAQGGTYDDGTIFKVTPSGAETSLYCFGPNQSGAGPESALIRDTAGNFYGTTPGGGNVNNGGTLFKVSLAGVYTLLHPFGHKGDGSLPLGPPVMSTGGTLYGTTSKGGTNGCGMVYEQTAAGKYTMLHQFATDECTPTGNLLRTNAGAIYGATSETLFTISATGVESTLYSFVGITPGYIVRSTAGGFFGPFNAAGSEGVWNWANGDDNTINFTGVTDEVLAGPVVIFQNNVYGASYNTGLSDGGTVYQFDPETGLNMILYTFPEGTMPMGGVIADAEGNLYGTTWGGGTYGYGTVFKLTPSN